MTKKRIGILIGIIIVLMASFFMKDITNIVAEEEKIRIYSDFRDLESIKTAIKTIKEETGISVYYVDFKTDADIILNYGSDYDNEEYEAVQIDKDYMKFVTKSTLNMILNYDEIKELILNKQELNSDFKLIMSPLVLDYIKDNKELELENAIVSDTARETIRTDKSIVGLLFGNEINNTYIVGNNILDTNGNEIIFEEKVYLLIRRDSKYFSQILNALDNVVIKGGE